MKRQIAIAAAVLFSCAALAGPKEDAMQVANDWARAFEARDVDAIVKLYVPNAQFFGTGSKTLVTTPDGVRAYFDAAFKNGPAAATLKDPSVAVLSDGVVAVAGMDEIRGNVGRVTLIIANTGGGWKIVQFHRSRVPQ